MQKRPPSQTRGSARVDAILRYRNANEGVLCSARCRELSRSGLTATIERPVFPGDLLRFDLEPPSGGPSVMGLARVAWTGSDPEGELGSSVMRLRFLSLGEASESALLAWLDELSAVAERPSWPHDDSSVRALSRAIADSLLPPPPVLPGAPPPSDESSGLSPAPIAVPNRPSIPPPPGMYSAPPPGMYSAPPGMYSRSSRTLSHPVDHVDPAAHDFGASAAAMRAPDRISASPPPLPFQPAAGSSSATTTAATIAARSKAIRETRRTAEVRERLSQLQRRRDQTPLMVPLEVRTPVELAAPLAARSSPAVARMTLSPPLPLGALLNAPPETTRRSTPPPAGPVAPPSGTPASSSSWPALRVPASVTAAMAPELEETTAPSRRFTIPPPAEIPEMPSLRVSSPPPDPAERASLPIDGPSLPLSDAPWSVPAAPPERSWLAHRWLALGVSSVAVGATLAYLAYGPSLGRRPPPASQLVASGAAASGASAAAAELDPDRLLAADMAMPAEPGAHVLEGSEAAGPQAQSRLGHAPIAKPAKVAELPRTAPAVLKPAPVVSAAPVVSVPPSASQAPQPLPQLKPLATAAAPVAGPGLPPPPPALPAELAAPVPAAAQPSKLDRARACLARGDNDCAANLLKGASTEPELELWIETLRAQGRAVEARRDMQRFIELYPDGRRTAGYQRILGNAP